MIGIDPDTNSPYLVTVKWLAAHSPGLKIIDASWYMPAQNRNCYAEFKTGHIPGAVFFDIEAIADQASDHPHMLPTPDEFAQTVAKLGIGHHDTIIVYDTAGLFSAARVWWSLTIMGARDVRVLQGGLPAWQQAGHKIDDHREPIMATQFNPFFNTKGVKNLAEMRDLTANRTHSILDARPADRFFGRAPEPRPGLPSGHMPGSTSLTFDQLLDQGAMKPTGQLFEIFADLGLAPDNPVTTTCGSGVTAAVLALGLVVAGHTNVSLYDGSWTQWASDPNSTIIRTP